MTDAKIVRKCKTCKKSRVMYTAGGMTSNDCKVCLKNMYNEWQWEVYTDLDINR